MKMPSRSTKLATSVLAVTVLLAIWTLLGANRAEAVIAIIRTTGIFSLAQGQATSAHVVNTGEEHGIVIDWRVLDSAGNILAHSEHETIELGQASLFEYGTGVYRPARLSLRVVLTVEGANGSKPGFIATQEVYDIDSGKTTVFLPYME